VGEKDEYMERMFPFWPVTSAERNSIGSWSLNGNHDMYSGGEGYFDTLLRKEYMLRWHGDDAGEPSSFFPDRGQGLAGFRAGYLRGIFPPLRVPFLESQRSRTMAARTVC
jgi:hypothetical protein